MAQVADYNRVLDTVLEPLSRARKLPRLPKSVATIGATTRCVNPDSNVLAIPKARASVHPLRLYSAQIEMTAGSGGATKNCTTNPAATAISMQMHPLETAASKPAPTEPRDRAARNPASPHNV